MHWRSYAYTNKCRKPVMNALCAACAWVLAICERIRSCVIHLFTFEERYSSLYFVDPNEAPKRCFSSVVICTPLPWKMVLPSPSTSCLIMSHGFEASGKYPNLGPNSHNWSHQYFNSRIQPVAVRSSACAAAFDMPSE